MFYKMQACLGEDRLVAMQAAVDARRAARKEDDTFLSRARTFFSRSLEQMVRANVTMQTLKERGFVPLDLMQRKVRWDDLEKYNTSALRDFGINFDTALELGFMTRHFKPWCVEDFRIMGVGVAEMLQTNITMPDVLDLKLTPTDLYELGWRYDTFKKIGADEAALKKLCSEADMRIYFQKAAQKKKVFSGSIKF